MTKFTFNTRASYLQWRAEWKANYKQISTDIRRLKKERSEANSAWSKNAYDPSRNATLWWKFCLALTSLKRMQQDANEALITLSEAKIEAARQWEDEHTEKCDCGKPWAEPHSCSYNNNYQYCQNHREDHSDDLHEPA